VKIYLFYVPWNMIKLRFFNKSQISAKESGSRYLKVIGTPWCGFHIWSLHLLFRFIIWLFCMQSFFLTPDRQGLSILLLPVVVVNIQKSAQTLNRRSGITKCCRIRKGHASQTIEPTSPATSHWNICIYTLRRF